MWTPEFMCCEAQSKGRKCRFGCFTREILSAADCRQREKTTHEIVAEEPQKEGENDYEKGTYWSSGCRPHWQAAR